MKTTLFLTVATPLLLSNISLSTSFIATSSIRQHGGGKILSIPSPKAYGSAEQSYQVHYASFGLDFLGLNPKGEKDGSSQKKSNEIKAKIDTVESIDDFLQYISEDERLCIVKFRASWCKSCQKFDVQFKKLANKVADKIDPKTNKIVEKGKVRMVDVEFGANTKLCRTLGIKKLPYIHFYRGSRGRVADFVCSPKKFPILLEKMNEHLAEKEPEIKTEEKRLDEEEKFDKVMEKGTMFMNNTVMNEITKKNDTHSNSDQ